jgi:hypothetical protein
VTIRPFLLPALLALAACGEAAPGNAAGPAANAAAAATPRELAQQRCAAESKKSPGNPDRPETWGRSAYDICLQREANKSTPADEEICPDTIHNGRCVLLIM